MYVIVTGCGGFIGNYLVKKLSKGGHFVYGYYRNKVPKNILGLKNVIGKKIDLVNLKQIDHPANLVIHCAAEQPETSPNLDEMMETNISACRAIFETSYKHGVKKFIYLSSMAIYGQIKSNLVDEKTPINNPNEYGISKLDGEKILFDMNRLNPSIDTLVLRLPGIVGKKSHSNFLSDTIHNIKSGEKIRINNSLSLFNGVIHVEDLCNYLLYVIKYFPKGHNVATIASSNPVPFEKVISIIFKTLGIRENVGKKEINSNSFTISNKNIMKFGYKPISVIDTIKKFATEHK